MRAGIICVSSTKAPNENPLVNFSVIAIIVVFWCCVNVSTLNSRPSIYFSISILLSVPAYLTVFGNSTSNSA